MSYRDWGRGEDGPRGRRSIARWDDPADRPVDPYASGSGDYRTPSRRRAIERGQQEPVDAYLPRWALESGVRRADGGGRHAAPDDDDDGYELDAPRSTGGWQATETTSGWRRVAETSWRETPAIGAAPDSDHTREWTFDRPQEQGYVGSRRADDEPVSDVGRQTRPRRATSRRPQVVWSGIEETEEPAEPGPAWSAERPGRRSRRSATPPPAVDPWDREARRAAELEESSYRPAVDPWDASGVHAWQPVDEVDRWGRADTPGRWQQPDDTAQWQQPDSTGQWDRYTEPRWDRTEVPRSDGGTGGWSWSTRDDREEGFWSGTRLAGDDPRWMDPPPSAPRSPVVAYTAPRPRTAPRRRVEPQPAAPAATIASVRRRIETVGTGPWARRIEDDLLDPDPGGPLRPLLYTAACYLLPAIVIFVWLLTLDGSAPPGCVTDISGGGCDSPRSRALGSLVEAMPRFGLALASSLVVALLLRRVGTTWRAATVALAAAVVGGGLSTVMISAVTGQPIG
ncbi:hypothetical protein ACTMS0_04960 [Micromonospora sp. H33]|uniref:hypothetical protein n=1 Tax=Micromonospora sp. H33 TaxID=3452215 RepID=UPI003F88D9C0